MRSCGSPEGREGFSIAAFLIRLEAALMQYQLGPSTSGQRSIASKNEQEDREEPEEINRRKKCAAGRLRISLCCYRELGSLKGLADLHVTDVSHACQAPHSRFFYRIRRARAPLRLKNGGIHENH